MADAVIRPYRPADRDEVYDVCLRTAAAGGDATDVYRDPALPGDLFAGPYLYLEPDFAFVLDDGERVSGYVIGTPDTTAFARKLREQWLPLVGPRHPLPPGPPADHEESMVEYLHHPERMIIPALADYPAHLHINILPHLQRSGWGRTMIDTLFDAFRAAGVPRLHLGTTKANAAAIRFYERLGFHRIDVPDTGGLVYLGRSVEIG
jgi:ribosomal protein S18 acetylase RimI-like enzyme